jgi:DNA-binding transcriptional MerR regulator
MAETNYTLSDLVELTGAKRRSIQIWTDRRVLIPNSETESAGSGTHRRYKQQELEIAAILAPLSQMGVPIGHLGRVAKHLRKLQLWTRRGSDQARGDLAIVEKARKGVGENYMLFSDIGAKRPSIEFLSGRKGVANVRLPEKASSGILINLNKAWMNTTR